MKSVNLARNCDITLLRGWREEKEVKKTKQKTKFSSTVVRSESMIHVNEKSGDSKKRMLFRYLVVKTNKQTNLFQ